LLDRMIAIKKEELKIREEDHNIGGGRSGMIGNPVELTVMREQSNEFILLHQKWKKAIEETYWEQSDEVRKIICLKYWSNETYLTWHQIGARFHIAKTPIYEIREKFLTEFARKIGRF